MDSSKLTSLFVSPDERLVAVLGNSIAETFLSKGVLGNGFAVLSDRRVYFRGRCLVRTGKRFHTQKEERTIDAQDITGIGFVHQNPIWLLVLAWILGIAGLVLCALGVSVAILALIPACILAGIYCSQSKTLFEISYAGGGIGFDVQWFPAEESQLFQKQVKLVSDACKKQATQPSGKSGVADELQKLALLLEKGLITQEEFDAQKRQLFQ